MNLRDLRYLVAVADERHFGRAAEVCFVSQPTLSTQLRKLERELGVELIERNPRHVALTPVGEIVVERARTIVREADAIVDDARMAQDPATGSLRMGVFPTLAPYLLPRVVPSLHQQFPALELLLVEEKTEVLHQSLRDGTLDVAVLARPIHDDTLHEEPLFDEDFLLAVPVDHHLAGRNGPIESSVLAGEELLLLEEGHCLRDQALSVCHYAGGTERRGFRATSLETLRQMVAAGVGVTLLPELATRPPIPSSDGVVLLRFADPVPQRHLAMYWRQTSPFRQFLPAVAAAVAASVPGDSRMSVSMRQDGCQ